ncbi:MAG TPA: hypothetical protein VN704_10740 [Verrucomicrobiae bacterium]|nr:hypothetical protein [Verrucomicrobiae bacterium]
MSDSASLVTVGAPSVAPLTITSSKLGWDKNTLIVAGVLAVVLFLGWMHHCSNDDMTENFRYWYHGYPYRYYGMRRWWPYTRGYAGYPYMWNYPYATWWN